MHSCPGRKDPSAIITPLYLTSSATRPHLRVAVLLDGPKVPRYVAAILEDLARCNFAEVVLAVVLEAIKAPPGRRTGLAHELYVRVDRAVGGDTDPLALVDPGVGLEGVARLDVAPAPGAEGGFRLGARQSSGETPWLPAEALDELQNHDLDVILRFCTAVPHGEVLRAARHGVWSYHFGADEHPRGATPFFQQVADGAPTRDVLLEVLAESPAPSLVLCRSTFGSHGNLFLAHYRQVAFWETTHFVVWKLHDLHEHGWEHLREQAVTRASEPAQLRPPTPGDMVRFLAPRVTTAVTNRLRGEAAVANRWRMGLRRGATPFGNTPEETSLAGFHWLETPRGHLWADPFLVERGSTCFLYFEDFDHETGYASIKVAEVQPDCTLSPPVTALDLGYHLSFPFVFEHEGEMFMLPESIANGTLTLYRARRFPEDWVQEKVLFRGNAADTTFWQEGGRYYFFTTLHDRDDRGVKTLLFVTDSLTGEWRLHPWNPVSSDVRHARNAGAIFRRGERLFRPTQNGGPSYGYGLNLEEIVTLSDARYQERPWCAVGPEALPFPAMGVHTYNLAGDLEVIDGCALIGPPPRSTASWGRGKPPLPRAGG